MKHHATPAWRRRHWLAFCLSTLVTACGGGGDGGEWDTTATWDQTNWS